MMKIGSITFRVHAWNRILYSNSLGKNISIGVLLETPMDGLDGDSQIFIGDPNLFIGYPEIDKHLGVSD